MCLAPLVEVLAQLVGHADHRERVLGMMTLTEVKYPDLRSKFLKVRQQLGLLHTLYGFSGFRVLASF